MTNPFKNKDILSSKEITKDELTFFLNYTEEIEKAATKYKTLDLCKSEILATIFFEPSTRTRLSFESAMLRLSGQMITVEQAFLSSAKKGETLEDMARVLSPYADVSVIRHPEVNSASKFASASTIPVINGGDGQNEHPTQALLDLYTIYKYKKHIEPGMTIGFLGDLKNGRTVHSLIEVLNYYQLNYVFISAPELQLDPAVVNKIKESGSSVTVTDQLDEVIPSLDIIYSTRIQEERFSDPAEYQKVKGQFQLNGKVIKDCKNDTIILHPLPRLDEIAPDVDNDPRGIYFQQAENGLYARMALLSLVLDKML